MEKFGGAAHVLGKQAVWQHYTWPDEDELEEPLEYEDSSPELPVDGAQCAQILDCQ